MLVVEGSAFSGEGIGCSGSRMRAAGPSGLLVAKLETFLTCKQNIDCPIVWLSLLNRSSG